MPREGSESERTTQLRKYRRRRSPPLRRSRLLAHALGNAGVGFFYDAVSVSTNSLPPENTRHHRSFIRHRYFSSTEYKSKPYLRLRRLSTCPSSKCGLGYAACVDGFKLIKMA